MRRQLSIILIVLTFSLLRVWGQSLADTTSGINLPAVIENGDTIALANMDAISLPVYNKPVFENKREERRYGRLLYNIKKVFPYARLARTKLEEMNKQFVTLTNEKQKKEYTKQVEKEIRDQFEGQLKNLTRTQGAILIKLIDRETGRTSYELVKEFRGSFNAFLWQTLARLFGHNLKTKYDPQGEDKPIEEIVIALEAGLI